MVLYRNSKRNKLSADASTCFTLKLCPSFHIFFGEQVSLLKTTRMTGVEFLAKISVFNADFHFRASVRGTKMKVFARREVIISGGVVSLPKFTKLGI